MKAAIQRVREAKVTVEGKIVAQIGAGMLVLLGVAADDTEEKAKWLARKIADLRIMSDAVGKMNLSVKDTGGDILVVSQFTLLAETVRGNRPSFTTAAQPEKAERLYQLFVEELRNLGISKVETGQFLAHMEVSLVNDGPVTIVLDV